MRVRALLTALLALPVASCATVISGQALPAGGADEQGRTQVSAYFADLNEAGTQGPSAQRDFLRRTQHPDYADRFCDLGQLTLKVDPALSTLRLDPKWKPERATTQPRGVTYVIGVSIAIRRDNTTLGEQIGSQRVVVLDGDVFGFTPCPTR